MATNTGKSYRKGAVKGKSQTYNPVTGQYVKRDTTTGRFEATKKDGSPFKGVTKERVTILVNPNIPRETIAKAQQVVAAALNRHKV
jgi:hypothetical protein